MFEEIFVVVALRMTSQWRHKVLSFSDMESFWCRWAWNWPVNELDSTCCHPKTSKYTSNYYGRQTLWDPTFLRLFFNAWTLVDDIPAMAVLEPAETFIIMVFWRQVII